MQKKDRSVRQGGHRQTPAPKVGEDRVMVHGAETPEHWWDPGPVTAIAEAWSGQL